MRAYGKWLGLLVVVAGLLATLAAPAFACGVGMGGGFC